MHGQKQLILATLLATSALITLQGCGDQAPKTGSKLTAEQRARLANGNAANGNTQGNSKGNNPQTGTFQTNPQNTSTTPVVDPKTNTVNPPEGVCRITELPSDQAAGYYGKEPFCDSISVTTDANSRIVLPTTKMNLTEQKKPVVFADAQTIPGGKQYSFASDGSSKILPILYALPASAGKIDPNNVSVGFYDDTVASGIATLTRGTNYNIVAKNIAGADGKTTQTTAIEIMPETIRTLNFAVFVTIGDKGTISPVDVTPSATSAAVSTPDAVTTQVGGAQTNPPAAPPTADVQTPPPANGTVGPQ